MSCTKPAYNALSRKTSMLQKISSLVIKFTIMFNILCTPKEPKNCIQELMKVLVIHLLE